VFTTLLIFATLVTATTKNEATMGKKQQGKGKKPKRKRTLPVHPEGTLEAKLATINEEWKKRGRVEDKDDNDDDISKASDASNVSARMCVIVMARILGWLFRLGCTVNPSTPPLFFAPPLFTSSWIAGLARGFGFLGGRGGPTTDYGDAE
jgi:hypothetical protein